VRLEYAAPFVTALEELLRDMAGLKVFAGRPRPRDEAVPSFETAALVEISGDAIGTVALSLPRDVAVAVVRRFARRGPDERVDVNDGLGELVNIVAGSAKDRVNRMYGLNIDTSTPVAAGRGAEIWRARLTPLVLVPLTCEAGRMALEVGFRQRGGW